MKKRLPGLEVRWRAFELRPEPVPTLDPGGEYLRRAWSQSVYPLARRLGVPMQLPSVQPRSRLAHETAAWAGARGAFEVMHAAIFRAFFEQGRDIGDPAVLSALAREAGMEWRELEQALAGCEYLPQVLRDEAESHTRGVRAVPAFVARGAILFGMQTADALEALFGGPS